MLRLSTLRRLLLAYLGFRFAEFGVWVGLAASAYEAGGVGEATAVMLAQLLPAGPDVERFVDAAEAIAQAMPERALAVGGSEGSNRERLLRSARAWAESLFGTAIGDAEAGDAEAVGATAAA